MKPVRALARLALLPLILPLAACGGSDGGSGGGGIVSTPPPTYTKLADLTGNQTFQSASVHFGFQTGTVLQKVSTEAFGSGVKIAYATTGDYTLTFADGRTSTLSPSSNPQPAGSYFVPFQGDQPYAGQTFQLTIPSINGVKLSYTALGTWQDTFDSYRQEELAVTGIPTVASDIPHNGSASYTSAVGGLAYILSQSNGGFLGNVTTMVEQKLSSQSSATFSADFGAGTVATNLHLIGTSGDLGSFSGTGTIAANSPGFTGTFANTTASSFSGAFFGPQASEMAYGWYLSTASMTAIGTAWGKKN